MSDDIEKQIRFFWMGKRSKTRKAVEAFLKAFEEQNRDVTQHTIQLKYGTYPSGIRYTIRRLRESNLLSYYLSEETINHIDNVGGFIQRRWRYER